MPATRRLEHLAARGDLEGVVGRLVARALEQVGARVVDADDGRAGELLLARVELVDAHAEALGDLLVIGRAAELRLEPAGGVAQLVREAPHVARQRVTRAQVVEHGAADAELGEGLEAVDALRIEALGRLHEADDARRDEVVDLDVGGQAGAPADARPSRCRERTSPRTRCGARPIPSSKLSSPPTLRSWLASSLRPAARRSSRSRSSLSPSWSRCSPMRWSSWSCRPSFASSSPWQIT